MDIHSKLCQKFWKEKKMLILIKPIKETPSIASFEELHLQHEQCGHDFS